MVEIGEVEEGSILLWWVWVGVLWVVGAVGGELRVTVGDAVRGAL